jgi:hypothetical protein
MYDVRALVYNESSYKYGYGLINSIRQQRMLKMMAIADDRHFRYDNENFRDAKGRIRSKQ